MNDRPDHHPPIKFGAQFAACVEGGLSRRDPRSKLYICRRFEMPTVCSPMNAQCKAMREKTTG